MNKNKILRHIKIVHNQSVNVNKSTGARERFPVQTLSSISDTQTVLRENESNWSVRLDRERKNCTEFLYWEDIDPYIMLH